MKEQEIIARIREAFPGSGIGDDAAVLPPVAGEMLFASDAVVQNVHFTTRFSTSGQAIQKIVTANVSDIYAMGGVPAAIVLTAGLPPGCGERDVDSIIEGLALACGSYGVALAGGDTVASPGGYFFDVAITGSVAPGRAVLRSGAGPGDAVVLFGEIGRSLAGLALLSCFFGPCGCGPTGLPAPRVRDCAAAGARMGAVVPRLSLATDEAALRGMAAGLAHIPGALEMLRCMRHHLAPRCTPAPAVRAGGARAPFAAMIDVSDGFAKDLRTLCAESGVGASIEAASLPIPGAVGALFGIEGDALIDFALSSGEEYVQLAAVPRESLAALPPEAVVVGRFTGAEEGITIAGPGGTRELPALGYEHSF